MTIITQALSEKKLSKQKEPLVDCEANCGDGDNGANSVIIAMRTRARKVNSLTTLCVCLTALIVLTTGIIGGVYLYRQFSQYKMRHFRGWCSVPYLESSDRFDHFQRTSTPPKHVFNALEMHRENFNIDEVFNDIQERLRHDFERFPNDNALNSDNFFDEEFDIDVEFEQYERIDVPDFTHGRRGRFIHDFTENNTGIVDLSEGRCFILPLNRSTVLPPKSLLDLVLKMRSGYYDIDTEIVRQYYRVITPPISDYKKLGYYIARECAKLPTYRLERITSPVYKRSVPSDGKVVFSEFAGRKINEIEIVNLHAAKGNK